MDCLPKSTLSTTQQVIVTMLDKEALSNETSDNMLSLLTTKVRFSEDTLHNDMLCGLCGKARQPQIIQGL